METKEKEQITFDYILGLAESIKLESHEFSGTHYHGSSKGEELRVTLYLDATSHQWTQYDTALTSAIVASLKPLISQAISSIKK